MELTLNNLINFVGEHFHTNVEPDTVIRYITNEVVLDGDEIHFFLNLAEKEFNVSFSNFDFKKYFLKEWELSNGCFTFGFVKVKKRNIEHELTIGELYEYMIKNRKLD